MERELLGIGLEGSQHRGFMDGNGKIHRVNGKRRDWSVGNPVKGN